MKLFSLQRGLVVALLISLGANMFLGGLALSRFHGPMPPPPFGLLDKMAETLPPADADILRQAIAEHRAGLAAEEARMHAFPHRFRAALLAEPFDPGAITAIFEDGHRQENLMGVIMAEAAARMSPEGRRQWAEFRP